MDAIPRRELAVALVLVVLAGLAGARMAGRGTAPAPQPPPEVRVDTARGAGDRVVVHVAGAVRRPGVYRMRAGARVDDAVRRAGGPTRRADLSAVNLAGELDDGRQILVPARSPTGAGVATSGAPASQDAPAPPLNLNQATLEQLDALEGIGPTTARKILDWRAEHGGFSDVEELGNIPGIGDKRLATLRERVVP